MLKPRWYQDEAAFSVINYFDRGGTGNPVVVMPTGTGKSLVIAELIRGILYYWPNQRVMMLTHVKELISQNAEKLYGQWPTAPLGIHSDGLSSRDTLMPIIYGGVKSVANTIAAANKFDDGRPPHMKHFGWRDLIFIDECHLFSPEEESQYNYVINELKKINPYLKVIGFTATPFRMKQGMITDGGIFTDICYDISGVESFNRLVYEGYLSPLIVKPTNVEIDSSNISIVGGEFNAKQSSNAVEEVLYNALAEFTRNSLDRQSWMAFVQSIDNCEHAAQILQSFGVDATCVHSKLKPSVNDERLKAYKAGEYRCMVNMGKLTTGFDHPILDSIGMLRLTNSPGLWVQMLGRGTRPAPWANKLNCLVQDFARNAMRLGPINDPRIPRKPGKGGGDAPVRICDNCGVYNHAAAKICMNCGTEFTFETKLFIAPGTTEVLKSDDAIIEYFNVHKAIYSLHEKKNKEGVLMSPPSIKVTYFAGLQSFCEWVCLEHNGLVGHKAREWWRQRHSSEPPPTVSQALRITSELRTPARIKVHVNKRYPEIISAEW